MNRIEAIFQLLRQDKKKALMPFICAGRPTVDRLPELLRTIESSGASIVEIGIPFSDPIADGPVIAAAMHEALLEGVTPQQVFSAVKKARDDVSLGLVAMVSASIVMRSGIESFAREAAAAGFDGLIVPDAPADEAIPIRDAAAQAGLTLSLLVAPATPPDRAKRITDLCSGFVYLLARAGITGERDDAPDIEKPVQNLRTMTELPIACGFGISSPEQVRAVVEHADAAIVGSALVRRIEDAIQTGEDPVAIAGAFVAELAAGLDASAA